MIHVYINYMLYFCLDTEFKINNPFTWTLAANVYTVLYIHIIYMLSGAVVFHDRAPQMEERQQQKP